MGLAMIHVNVSILVVHVIMFILAKMAASEQI